MKKIIFALCTCFLGVNLLQASAQSKLILHLNQNLQKEYALSDIQSLTVQEGFLKVSRSGEIKESFVFDERIKLTFTDLTTGLNEATLSSRSIAALYPKPTSGSLSIVFPLAASEKVEITILDITGNPVKQLLYAGYAGDNKVVWEDLNPLEPGSYLVKIKFNSHIETHKLIKY